MLRCRALACAVLALAWAGLARADDAPAPRQINLGTASSAGVYHQVGAALCRFVTIRAPIHGVTCRAEVSGGSRANIDGLMNGDVELAIVQANVLYNATHGVGTFFESGPRTRLRMVMRLYDENITLVTRRGSAIASLDDLRGKRVNLGPEELGTRIDAIRLLRAADMSVTDLGEALALSPEEHNEALCAGRIDAYFYVVGHPNRNTRAAIEHCGANLVPVAAAVRANAVLTMTAFTDAPIAGGIYPRHPDPIPTMSVAAVLVATEDTPADMVTLVVRGAQDNLRDFRRLHPVLSTFSDARAFASPLAPMHPGTLDRRIAVARP